MTATALVDLLSNFQAEKRKTLMFKKIVVAYNDSPEAGRALASTIRLAKLLEAELQVMTVMQELHGICHCC